MLWPVPKGVNLGGQYRGGKIDNFASTTTTVGDSADLAVTKTETPYPVNAGDLLTSEVTITNNGPSEATNGELFDSLPPEVSFVGATISNGSGADEPSHTVTYQWALLEAGDALEVLI